MCLLAVIIIHRTFLLLFLTLLFYRLAEHLNESLYRSYVCLAFSIVRARIIFFSFMYILCFVCTLSLAPFRMISPTMSVVNVYIYIHHHFFNEATMTIHFGRPVICLRVGTLVDVHVSQNQLCVLSSSMSVFRKKTQRKNVKC